MNSKINKLLLSLFGILLISSGYASIQTENEPLELATNVSNNEIIINDLVQNDNTTTVELKSDTQNNYTLSSVNEKEPINLKYQTESQRKVRVGAVCNDGTRSKATGRGACSHHGGVKYWLYKNV